MIRAFVVVREVFGLRELWEAVEALDNTVPTAAQTKVYLELRRLLDRAVRWLVTNRRSPLDVTGEIGRFAAVAGLLGELDTRFVGAERESLLAHMEEVEARGVPASLATAAARVMYGFGLLDVVETARVTARAPGDVAPVYFVLSDRFRVDALLSKISLLPRDDRWQTLARMALRYDLYAALAALTAGILQSTPDSAPVEERVEAWEAANATAVGRAERAINEFGESSADLAALSVLLRQIRQLVRQSSAN